MTEHENQLNNLQRGDLLEIQFRKGLAVRGGKILETLSDQGMLSVEDSSRVVIEDLEMIDSGIAPVDPVIEIRTSQAFSSTELLVAFESQHFLETVASVKKIY